MNAKPTPILFVAVALSALAAVLAGSAQARIPEGNGTQPPSKTVVIKQQSLQELLASSAQARIPEGNGTQPPFKTVATEQQAQLVTGTFFFSFTPDPAIYVVYGALISRTSGRPDRGAERSPSTPRSARTSMPRSGSQSSNAFHTLSRLPPRWSRRVRARRPSHTSSPPATAAFPRRRATPRGEDGAATAPSSRRQPLLRYPGRYEERPVPIEGPCAPRRRRSAPLRSLACNASVSGL